MEEHLIAIETKLAYLESYVDSLNEVVTKQQGQIDELNRQMRQVLIELRSVASVIKDKNDETPPPHF